MERIPDSVCNPNWDSLLKVFHSIDPDAKDSVQQYQELKEYSKTKVLTDRQREGIIARCDNRINGTYGSTSRSIESFKK